MRNPLLIHSTKQLLLLAIGVSLLAVELAAQPAAPAGSSSQGSSAPEVSPAVKPETGSPAVSDSVTAGDPGQDSPKEPSALKPVDDAESAGAEVPSSTEPAKIVPQDPAKLPVKPAVDTSESIKLLPSEHPWSGFPLGTWKLVRTISESLDAEGNITNVTTTETRTTLVGTTDENYTIKVEVTVEVGGKRFPSAPQLVKKQARGTEGQTSEVVALADSEILLDGRRVPCQVRQVSAESGEWKVESLLYTSSETYPHTVRRETKSTADDGRTASTIVEVIASGLPHKVLGETRATATVRTVQRHAKGSSITLEVHSPEIPGGVVSHAALELDAEGNPLRRSTLELVAYGDSGPNLPQGNRRRVYRTRGR